MTDEDAKGQDVWRELARMEAELQDPEEEETRHFDRDELLRRARAVMAKGESNKAKPTPEADAKEAHEQPAKRDSDAEAPTSGQGPNLDEAKASAARTKAKSKAQASPRKPPARAAPARAPSPLGRPRGRAPLDKPPGSPGRKGALLGKKTPSKTPPPMPNAASPPRGPGQAAEARDTPPPTIDTEAADAATADEALAAAEAQMRAVAESAEEQAPESGPPNLDNIFGKMDDEPSPGAGRLSSPSTVPKHAEAEEAAPQEGAIDQRFDDGPVDSRPEGAATAAAGEAEAAKAAPPSAKSKAVSSFPGPAEDELAALAAEGGDDRNANRAVYAAILIGALVVGGVIALLANLP